MKYHVWRVIENEFEGEVFKRTVERCFIINRETKEIQSTWKSIREAQVVCDDLNKKVA